jgi:hypothetical protein
MLQHILVQFKFVYLTLCDTEKVIQRLSSFTMEEDIWHLFLHQD